MAISTISSAGLAAAAVGTSQLATSPTITTPTIAQINSASSATPTIFADSAGTQVGTLCRAWVNFNGTGTVAIRASFNVSSITDNGTGDYTVNFTNAMSDANYGVAGTARQQSAWSTGNANLTVIMASSAVATAQTTSTCRIWVQAGPGALYDTDTVCLSIFR